MAGLMVSTEKLRGIRPADAERGVQVATDGARMAVKVEERLRRRRGPKGCRWPSGREQIRLLSHVNNASCGFGAAARFGRLALIGRSSSRPSFGSGGGFGRQTCR
jgi:hypothetical protein